MWWRTNRCTATGDVWRSAFVKERDIINIANIASFALKKQSTIGLWSTTTFYFFAFWGFYGPVIVVLRCTSVWHVSHGLPWLLPKLSRQAFHTIWKATIIKDSVISHGVHVALNIIWLSYCVRLWLCGCADGGERPKRRDAQPAESPLLFGLSTIPTTNTLRYCRRKHMSLHLSPPTQISAVGKHANYSIWMFLN